MTRKEWGARLALVDSTGRMLFTRDAKKGHTKVLGGGGEDGESFEEATIREAYQESGGDHKPYSVRLNKKDLIYLDTQDPNDTSGDYGPALAHWFMAIVEPDVLDSLHEQEGGDDVRSMFVDRVENAKKLLGHDAWKRFFQDRLQNKILRHLGM